METDISREIRDVGLDTERLAGHISWLREFEAREGRPLRVLHIGNIANNAYLNAKFLRSVGVDAHVVSYSYDHVMATPEWEEVEILHDHGDDFSPKFSKHDLSDYRRPNWFVSGPLVVCVSAIAELCGERPSRLLKGWHYCFESLLKLTSNIFGERAGFALELLITNPQLLARKIWEKIFLRRLAKYRTFDFDSRLNPKGSKQRKNIIKFFDKVFADRPDRLMAEDIAPFQSTSSHFRRMFQNYDIVQSYATEPIHALLSEKRPYVAFEHGTLRDFTMGDEPLHRLTALSYRNADHTFITNGDCRAYAESLGIENHSPIIHPIDVEQHRQDFGVQIDNLRQDIGGEYILFCPIRHDWKVKGTDVHLRALPIIKEKFSRNVKLVLIRWGAQVADSVELLKQLGCENDVVWRPSMCRMTMIKHIQAADVVLDQMALPHFGSTAPQSIAAGVPVISSYEPDSTQYIIPEAAPILPAFTPEEVCDGVKKAVGHSWRSEFKKRAHDWVDKYHHPNNVISNHLDVYIRILKEQD